MAHIDGVISHPTHKPTQLTRSWNYALLLVVLIFWGPVPCIAVWDMSEVLQGRTSQDSSVSSSSGSSSSSNSDSYRKDGLCSYSGDASDAMKYVLCSVESGAWYIPPTARAIKESPCLIDQVNVRCKEGIRHIPLETEVPKSALPPDAKNKDYQRYAEKAEELVEQTWWRQGFADDQLLLSHNDKELPKKLFNEKKIYLIKN